ncbi:MAG: hypothetical protein U0X73_18110 [Thermoanaerobaculia bacterium]
MSRSSRTRWTTTARRSALALPAVLLFVSPAGAVKRRAFATSVTGSGNLSTWAGATGATALDRGDSICRARATAAGLPNAGTYRVWLSANGTDAYCHVQGLAGTKSGGCNGAALPGGGPWYLANGVTNFTGTLDQLTGAAGVIYRSVTTDEFTNDLPDDWTQRRYWTGSRANGKADSARCSDFTSASGSLQGLTGDGDASAIYWTDAFEENCDQPMRLLCFEPGASDTATLHWSPGAIAFVTSAFGGGELGAWAQSDGQVSVTAGYHICQNLAAAAFLPVPASFVPWLSSPLADAVDRLSTDGPFRRVDGYTVASDLAQLTSGAPQNSLHVDEFGHYLTDANQVEVWTGTFADGTREASETCDNWLDGTNAFFGLAGRAPIGHDPDWTEQSGYLCLAQARLYCFSNSITIFWDGFEITGDASRWSTHVP